MRCSITFANVSSLVNGLKKFIKQIENNEIDCLVKIARIKNGFTNILKWKNVDDASYVDIKFNIVYVDKNTDERMIIEAQFLLEFLLTAKKMGHKLYAVNRQDAFINNVTNQVYGVDNNYELYKNKINKLVNNLDVNNFVKECFWRPNMVVSIINRNQTKFGKIYFSPLLNTIGLLTHVKKNRKSGFKLYQFFLNCLHHFGTVVLDEKEVSKDEKNHTFLQRYFRFSHFDNLIVHSDAFWGISTKNIDSKNSIKYKIVDSIMNQSYFSYFRNTRDGADMILMRSINQDGYYYMSLLLKYCDKLKDYVCEEMRQEAFPGTILRKYRFKYGVKKQEYFKLYLELSDKSNTRLNDSQIKNVYDAVEYQGSVSDESIKECKEMMDNYVKLHPKIVAMPKEKRFVKK